MKKSTLDYIVGIFIIGGFLCFVYLSMQLGEFSVFSMEKNYTLLAEFDGVSGLKTGAAVEIAGVSIGKVSKVVLGENDRAQVSMQITREVKITKDAMASIKTQGIIGDKYVRIVQGGDEKKLDDGGRITETESALDLEELVSKYIFGKV